MSHAIEPEPKVPVLVNARDVGFTQSRDRMSYVLSQPRRSVFVRTLSAQSVKVWCPRGAPYCPAHQRHALDRNTFRQSTRGLTISRGASSPILLFRHLQSIGHYDTAVPLRPDSRLTSGDPNYTTCNDVNKNKEHNSRGKALRAPYDGRQ